ncbi:DUF4266 domain-containing protein [Solimonas sp. K1W22B-7]|uniref:DUF4266 domain-containing protein n=1 Tax=Solimonas sp. K1W22B-7 TaxID=2303331 RepID=UPI000E330BA0|nr:DUF4266 domain-containing protein [Solimonas sp. K1W22B-7]AXQ31520.1 DUF4266 domain-containing protein [Solimonas sp. K1W22B-7]
MRLKLTSGAVLAALLLSGCATTKQDVQPWQRGTLAKSEMAWEPDPLTAEFRRHVQFSKEAASGGASLGGGGCGCN